MATGQIEEPPIDGSTLFLVKRSDLSEPISISDNGEDGDEDEDEDQDVVAEGDENGEEEEEKMLPPQEHFKFESGLCPASKRSKRGSDPQFNLRTLMATFKSIQKGNFTGGLLEPFMVS